MKERCGEVIFGRHLSVSHCGLTKNHDGKHVPQSEVDAEAERMSTRQLDLDLTHAWHPGGPATDEMLPEGLMADQD